MMGLNAGVLGVTVYRSIRDESGTLLRTDRQRWFVHPRGHLRDQMLRLVWERWAEATREEIHRHDAPDTWDGKGEVWWTTAAEVDGVVRPVVCRPRPFITHGSGSAFTDQQNHAKSSPSIAASNEAPVSAPVSSSSTMIPSTGRR